MGEQHIDDLHNALERNHWNVVGQESNDAYNVPVIWVIARPDGSSRLHLVFEVPSDLEEGLMESIEHSLGCHLDEAPRVSLYFARISRSWKRELAAFITKLNAVGPD